MMKTRLAGLFLAVAFAFSASAQITIRIGPPRAIQERRPPAPGRGYVWIPGFQNWNGQAHEWRQGRWEQPPRGHKHWQKDRWERRRGEWVLMPGRWR